jgi:aspartate aminotransferase
MGSYLDSVPFSGIIRIRDMMYGVERPFRLDQGDVSFDAPDTVKQGMLAAIAANQSHYLQTAGLPRLRELVAEKLRSRNRIPVTSADEVLVTTGGVHALYLACQALLDIGDEVVIPDPTWPPMVSCIMGAHGVPVGCRLHESLGWRFDLDELASAIGPRTKALYINSPHNPTGGVLTREDLEAVADLARRHDLWVISDEAYEDVIYDGTPHVSIASLDGMHDRTLSVFTFSKSYAMTGLRLGYVVAGDAVMQSRITKILFCTCSNVTSVVQFGGIGALEGSQAPVREFVQELDARRHLFYEGIRRVAGGVLSGEIPRGAFYAFLRIEPSWQPSPAFHPRGVPDSRSWALVEELITRARIGCVPGVEFGPNGEDHVRFCFSRGREELQGALDSMRSLFS